MLVAGQGPCWPHLAHVQRRPREPRCLPRGSLPSPWLRLPSPASPGGWAGSQQKQVCTSPCNKWAKISSPAFLTRRRRAACVAMRARCGLGLGQLRHMTAASRIGFFCPLLAVKQWRKQSAGIKMNSPSLDL